MEVRNDLVEEQEEREACGDAENDREESEETTIGTYGLKSGVDERPDGRCDHDTACESGKSLLWAAAHLLAHQEDGSGSDDSSEERDKKAEDEHGEKDLFEDEFEADDLTVGARGEET